MDNDTNTTKDTVVALWGEAYTDWQDGTAVSPSATDLARIAHEVDPFLHGYTDAVADAIYDAEQDGNDLATVYDIVYR